MKIDIQSVSKKYNQHWIVKQFSYAFSSGKKYAITGPNGSGKSTLLKTIAAITTPESGKIYYAENDKNIPAEEIYKNIAIAAPYLDLPEYLTISELVQFHHQLKKIQISPEELIAVIKIDKSKLVRELSSGMKQRLKLALAFFSDSKILLLDEPTANFDDYWKGWYISLIEKMSNERLLIICSNEKAEYAFCDEVVLLSQ